VCWGSEGKKKIRKEKKKKKKESANNQPRDAEKMDDELPPRQVVAKSIKLCAQEPTTALMAMLLSTRIDRRSWPCLWCVVSG
jgi:hypothetical protein